MIVGPPRLKYWSMQFIIRLSDQWLVAFVREEIVLVWPTQTVKKTLKTNAVVRSNPVSLDGVAVRRSIMNITVRMIWFSSPDTSRM